MFSSKKKQIVNGIIRGHLQEINRLEKKLQKEKENIENKENNICNLLEANKELSIANSYLEKKIIMLEKALKKKEIMLCDLNTRLCVAEDKIKKLED